MNAEGVISTVGIKVSVPDGSRLVYPEIQFSGPQEYQPCETGFWHHPTQLHGVKGSRILKELEGMGVLPCCLGWRDLMAMKTKGAGFLAKNYPDMSVPGWKSVVDRSGTASVPILIAKRGSAEIIWALSDEWFRMDCPAVYFNKICSLAA